MDFLIKDTRFFLNRFEIVTVNHIYREDNRVADWLANEGHLTNHEINWSSSPSFQLDEILNDDKLGMTL